jgi:hypothetical protein
MGQYKNKNEVIDAILRRSTVDAEFRQDLLVNPITAVQQFFDNKVPDGLRVRFVEKPKDVDAIFVLPDALAQANLSEAELETVAGGVAIAGEACAEDPEGGWTCGLSCGCTGGTTV